MIKKILIWIMAFVLYGIVTMTFILKAIEKPKSKITLTASDREPIHIAYERLANAQIQYLQLQTLITQFQKDFEAESNKLKSKCHSDITNDFNCK